MCRSKEWIGIVFWFEILVDVLIDEFIISINANLVLNARELHSRISYLSKLVLLHENRNQADPIVWLNQYRFHWNDFTSSLWILGVFQLNFHFIEYWIIHIFYSKVIIVYPEPIKN